MAIKLRFFVTASTTSVFSLRTSALKVLISCCKKNKKRVSKESQSYVLKVKRLDSPFQTESTLGDWVDAILHEELLTT
jgi:hypothetical protein